MTEQTTKEFVRRYVRPEQRARRRRVECAHPEEQLMPIKIGGTIIWYWCRRCDEYLPAIH